MARKLKSDKVLFLATLLLVLSGWVMVYSASAALAMDEHGQPYHYLFRQVVWVVLGGCLLLAAARVDYRRLEQPGVVWTLLALATAALAAVLFFGPVINGSRRWFAVGGVGVQPSEAAKLAVIVFTAAFLARRMDRINELASCLLPVATVVGLVSGLILLQPDFGTALTLLLIAGAMVFAAGLNYRYVIIAALAGAPVLYGAIASSDYRLQRLLAFLDPWSDPLGAGYQLIQALIAVGTGGVLGQGLMAGIQKLFYLPYPHTDFIYAVIAEETGLIGATAIAACFCVITWRGFRIATLAPDRFGALLAVGLTTMIALQAFVNISVVLGLLPTKGIPLPFVSTGGSSLMVSMAGMGVLLSVSQHASMRT